MEPSEYLACLGRGVDVVPSDPEFLEWLVSVGVDVRTRAYFAAGWAAESDGMIGTGYPLTADAIMATAHDEPRWLRHGFLLIGSCGNGDPVAIDVRDQGAICFLSHEVLWPDDEADPREWSVIVAAGLGDFVKLAWDLDACPIDFWDARPDDGA